MIPLTIEELKKSKLQGKMWGLRFGLWVGITVEYIENKDQYILYFATKVGHKYNIEVCSLFFPVKSWKNNKPKYTKKELIAFGADKFWFI